MVKTVVATVAAAMFFGGLILQSMGADTTPPRIATPQLDPIRIEGPEQSRLIGDLPDGGLPPVVGVQNFQVFRCSHDAPEITDQKGWTYNHHIDIACWHGRLYVAWTNAEKDEDVWPEREVYSTSEDGSTWSPPAELFPQGISTSLRMYFFHAPNGRMLTIAGLRVSHDKLDESTKSGAVVREIRADHTLGDVFTLIASPLAQSMPKLFSTSDDPQFIEACEQLLANHSFLETQDYGVLLGDQKMKWHGIAAANKRMKSFGKAFSFFHRKDGALVGIAKSGWTIVSTDEGKTWSEPVRPKTLITNLAKVAGQHTVDDRYALVYNPTPHDRFPLAIVTGDDGVTFNNMRIVHGEVPRQRYQGENKNIGAQYVRCISEWATDGSRKDDAIWLAYSSNKEDIWVSRIPLPVKNGEDKPVADRFDDDAVGPLVPGWNTYSPKWAGVKLIDLPQSQEKCLQLEDADPYDYARAQRVFPESKKVSAEFQVQVQQLMRGTLEIELCSAFGGARPVQIVLDQAGMIRCALPDQNEKSLVAFKPDQWIAMRIDADAGTQKFSLTLDGKPAASDLPFAERANDLARISFRTGEYRAVGKLDPVAAGTDKPTEAARFFIRGMSVK